jgi:site-specific DNA recombinase
MNKIAAIYVRVSKDYKENEAPINSQIDEVVDRIKEDQNILGQNMTFKDEWWSGDILARPDLDRMRDAAKRGEFEVLYVWDIDRLARRYSYQELVKDEIESYKIEFIDLHCQPIKNAEDKILNGVRGLFAEYERAKITERMRRGKMYKARQGVYCCSTANYGYRYVEKTKDKSGYLEINEEEARNVPIIFGLVCNQHLSIRKTILELQRLGIKPRKSKRGVWSVGTLCQILRDTIYIGKTYYNRTISTQPTKPLKVEKYKRIVKSSRMIRPKEEWIEMPAPRLINDDLFNATQAQLEKNSKFSPRNTKFPYLCNGLVYCSCGERLSGGKSMAEHYYRCIGRIKQFPQEPTCMVKGINVKRLDKPVWGKVKCLLTDTEVLEKQINKWRASQLENRTNTTQVSFDSIKKQINDLGEKEKKYARLLGEELLSEESYKTLAAEIKNKVTDLRQQQKTAEEDINQNSIASPASIDDELIKKGVADLISNLDKNDMRQVLLRLIDRIDIDKSQMFARIRGYIPVFNTLNTNQNVCFSTINWNCRIAQRGQVNFV